MFPARRADEQPSPPRQASDEQCFEPRWPSFVAVLAAGGLYFALHEDLIVGPRWLLPTLVVAFLIPTVISHRTGRHGLDRRLGFVVSSLLTLGLIASVYLLVRGLPSHRQPPVALMRSAVSLWCTNILVFALWYWRLDAGGPHSRDTRPTHEYGAFLFPQMSMPLEARQANGQTTWSPGFIDYLFLAFNTSTAFSPTDTAPLTSWAKLLMTLQSIISLTVIAVLAARAVNIL
jgi:hypothetical protein